MRIRGRDLKNKRQPATEDWLASQLSWQRITPAGSIYETKITSAGADLLKRFAAENKVLKSGAPKVVNGGQVSPQPQQCQCHDATEKSKCRDVPGCKWGGRCRLRKRYSEPAEEKSLCYQLDQKACTTNTAASCQWVQMAATLPGKCRLRFVDRCQGLSKRTCNSGQFSETCRWRGAKRCHDLPPAIALIDCVKACPTENKYYQACIGEDICKSFLGCLQTRLRSGEELTFANILACVVPGTASNFVGVLMNALLKPDSCPRRCLRHDGQQCNEGKRRRRYIFGTDNRWNVCGYVLEGEQRCLPLTGGTAAIHTT